MSFFYEWDDPQKVSIYIHWKVHRLMNMCEKHGCIIEKYQRGQYYQRVDGYWECIHK